MEQVDLGIGDVLPLDPGRIMLATQIAVLVF